MTIIAAFRIAEQVVVKYDSHVMIANQKFARKHHNLVCENFPVVSRGLTIQHDRKLLADFLHEKITLDQLLAMVNK